MKHVGWMHASLWFIRTKSPPFQQPPSPPHSCHVPPLPPSLPLAHALGFYHFFYFHFSLLILSHLPTLFFLSFTPYRQLSQSQTFPPSLNMARSKEKCVFQLTKQQTITTRTPTLILMKKLVPKLTQITLFTVQSSSEYKKKKEIWAETE